MNIDTKRIKEILEEETKKEVDKAKEQHWTTLAARDTDENKLLALNELAAWKKAEDIVLKIINRTFRKMGEK